MIESNRSPITQHARGLLVATLFALVSWGVVPPATAGGSPPLVTVPNVDLARYAGTWYEIASNPQKFQKGCTGTTATYTLRDDGTVEVVNRCARDSLDGRVTVARGRAKVADRSTNSKLKVSFFWPFWADYWIIDLGPRYEYAVVGHPNRKYLWILSRTPVMDDSVYAGILERLIAQSYDTSRLSRTLQPATGP
jgi:apolipoprotein D and lipocalin family protein